MPSHGDTFRAIKSKWAASPTLAGFDGPFRDVVPHSDHAEFPYVVIRHIATVRQQRTNRSNFWLDSFDIQFWDRKLELCDAHISTIGDVFDEATLAIDNAHCMLLQRAYEHTMQEEKGIAQGLITYELTRVTNR